MAGPLRGGGGEAGTLRKKNTFFYLFFILLLFENKDIFTGLLQYLVKIWLFSQKNCGEEGCQNPFLAI